MVSKTGPKEARNHTKDGLDRSLEDPATGVPGDEAQRSLAAEVTELTRQNEQLRQENQALKAEAATNAYAKLFENSFGSNALLERDKPGEAWRFKQVNTRLAGFLGQSVEDLAGKGLESALGRSAQNSGLPTALNKAARTGRLQEVSGIFPETGWNFQARILPLGENQAALAAMDMTPRVQYEDEQRILETIAENIPEGIAVVDADAGVVRLVSREGRLYAGLGDDFMQSIQLEEIGQLWKLSHPGSGEPLVIEEYPVIRSLQKGEIIKNLELVLTTVTGEQAAIVCQSVPIHDACGRISGAVVTWQDISEQKSRREERERLIAELNQERDRSLLLASEARQKADQLETIINAITDAVLIFRGGVLERINPTAMRAYGSDISGLSFKELYEKLNLRDMNDVLLKQGSLPSELALRGIKMEDVWMRFTDLNGKTHTALASAAPLYKDGVIDGSVAVWHDMTDREELLQALTHERSQVQPLLEHAPNGIVMIDRNGEITLTNPAAQRLRTNPLLEGQPDQPALDFTLCWPDGSACLPEEYPITRSLKNGEIHINVEMLYSWPDGQTRPVQTSSAPIRDPDGSISGAVAIFQDITELKKAAEAVRISQETWGLMGDAMPFGVWASQPDGMVTYVSPSFLELVGLTLEQMQAEGLSNVVSPEELDALMAAWEKARASEGMLEHTLRIRDRDGRAYSVLSRGLPLKDNDGQVTGWAGINLDITGLTDLERLAGISAHKLELQHQLIYHREQERLKIAQDLHDGPIQEIYGVVYSLKAIEDEAEDPAVVDNLKRVEDALQDMAREIRDFCNELRPPSLGAFGLHSAIRSLVDTLRARHPEVRFSLDLDDENLRLPPEVRLGMFRVCQELLNNVVRHSRATRAEVTLRIGTETAELEVQDNGKGFVVPEKWIDLAREGHLGLVGIQERVDAVNGTMDIMSEAGKGTTVRVAVQMP